MLAAAGFAYIFAVAYFGLRRRKFSPNLRDMILPLLAGGLFSVFAWIASWAH
jgi:hypothetical protein